MAASSNQLSLLDFPGEIRNQIYHYISADLTFDKRTSTFIESDHGLAHPTLSPLNYPSILYCNQQTRAEASAFILNRKVIFNISTHDPLYFATLDSAQVFPFERVELIIQVESYDFWESRYIYADIRSLCHFLKSRHRIQELRVKIVDCNIHSFTTTDSAEPEIIHSRKKARLIKRYCLCHLERLPQIGKCVISLPRFADGISELQEAARRTERIVESDHASGRE